MPRSFSSNLRGKVRNFPLPKNRPLVPLYEAVVNSINAIDERRKKDISFMGKIEIEIIREHTLISNSDNETINGFCIKDNGIGFDDNNMSSFMEADSEYKINMGGKGVGRFSWLKAFSCVQVESTYKDGNMFVTRCFDFSLEKQNIDDTLVENPNAKENCTTIKLIDYLEDYLSEVPKQVETIATRIIQHCFVYFLNPDCPEIIIFDTEKCLSLNKMFLERFTTEDNKSFFNIRGYEFNLLNIKISDKAFVSKNRLFLCANGRLVDSKDLEKLITNLGSDIYERECYWYLGILTGSYLDENVDMNRLSFSIPKENSITSQNQPCLDEIILKSCESIKEYLNDYLSSVEEVKQKRIKDYTTNVAPQYRHLLKYASEEIASLKPGLSNESLDDALYVIKRKFENKAKSECSELMIKLDNGDITSEEYQKRFQETIEKVSDVNRAALADYVVHRRIVLNLFRKGLNIKADGKFNLEKYMHQLIYPMRSTSDDIDYANHNLWIIDEKLSFCQYISSDKPFDNAPGEDRADLLFLDNPLDCPVAVAESQNTGLSYDSIIIFELKRPMRDDYNMQDNPIIQLQDYTQKILNGEAKDANHRPIKADQNTKFYLYAICDITPSLKRVLKNMSFTRTPDELGAFFYNSELHAYIEVLSFDKICNDSEKRNRVLFDKLGIQPNNN